MASQEARYSVTVYVNGVAVPGLYLARSHDKDTVETLTLSGHALVELKKGDVITAVLASETGGRTYKILAGECRLNLKQEKRF